MSGGKQGVEAVRREIAALAPAGAEVPGFDPRNGNLAAPLLILLETPGPAAVAERVVSQHNDSGTGRNLRRLLAEAGLTDSDLCLWNVVPWVLGGRSPRVSERRQGQRCLLPLLGAMPRLRVAMLLGRNAQAASATVAEGSEAMVLTAVHPSGQALQTPRQWDAAGRQFRAATTLLRVP